MEDWEKHKKNLLKIENVVAAMFFVSMIVSALKYVEELPWLGIPLIILDVIFMFCHCMSVYHEGASDAWRKAVDIQLKCQSEHRYKAIFWTYWDMDDLGADRNWRNGFYNRACKEIGIDQYWDLNEAPDVAEKTMSMICIRTTKILWNACWTLAPLKLIRLKNYRNFAMSYTSGTAA